MDGGRGADAVRIAGRLELLVKAVLAFARREVHLQSSAARRISALQVGQRVGGVLDAVEVDQAIAPGSVDKYADHIAVARALSSDALFDDLGDAVYPDAAGRHRLAEAELDAVRRIAQILSVQLAHRLHHRSDVAVLYERVRGRALLLDVDLDDLAEHLEMQSQMTSRYILLQVADEQGSCRLELGGGRRAERERERGRTSVSIFVLFIIN